MSLPANASASVCARTLRGVTCVACTVAYFWELGQGSDAPYIFRDVLGSFYGMLSTSTQAVSDDAFCDFCVHVWCYFRPRSALSSWSAYCE
jgi:hypothetical protein